MRSPHDSWAYNNRGIIPLLLLLPVGIAVSFSDPIIAEESILDIAMDTIGWLLFGLYLTFRIWATLYVGGRKDKELQTEGPYSITRNPLYVGSFCFALSAILFFKSLSLLFVFCIAWTAYLRWVIKAEERFIEQKFGEEFKKYYSRTPRLFPSLAAYRSGDSIEVKLKAIRTEAKRLWLSALLPMGAELIMHLRMASWWPHWFRLP